MDSVIKNLIPRRPWRPQPETSDKEGTKKELLLKKWTNGALGRFTLVLPSLLLLLLLLLVFALDPASAWKGNSYINITQAIAHNFNLSDCWVCTMMPRGGSMETPLMGIPVPFSNWSWPFDNFHHSTRPQGFHIYWAVGACGPGQHRTRLPNGEELCWGTENPLPSSTSPPPSAEQLCNENSFPRFEIQWSWESVVLNKNGSKNLGSYKDLPKNITHCPGSKGNCPIAIQIALNNSVRFGCPPKSLWWLCGDEYARKTLLESWGGACTVGALAPILSMHDRTNPLTGYLRTPWKMVGRALNPLVEKPTSFHSFVRWFIPFLGVSKLEKAIVNISATLEMIENATIDAIRGLQTEVSTLSKVVLQNRMALDLLSAKEGGVCIIINQSC
ncbi:uncharacterized protein LOC110391047 [Numida meleagris]|uniref:uncharacterized protein LOC110391047 n=1 Tax=Numida meleagris TaxID=8996 RepID=UPI000B3E0727|nr:uncharacterized protein LOC110391047 [Numida meleagris]